MDPVAFPVHTSAFIVALMLATGAGAWLLLSRGLRRAAISPVRARRWRWALALGLSGWLGGRLALSPNPPAAELLATPYSFLSFAFLLGGLTVGLVLLAASPTFRQVIHAVPTQGLVGLHAIRIGGFAWLALLDMDLLPAGFAVPTGYGDMAVGASALFVVLLVRRGHRSARTAVIGWNVLGVADFVLAVTAAFNAMAPFIEQATTAGASLAYLNYPFLIPSFGVPVFGLLHAYSLFQATRPAGTTAPEQYGVVGRIPPHPIR